MNPLDIAAIVTGMAILVVGADALVRGASRLAVGAKISPLAIGLTVVAFGTSAPELAVSVQAAVSGAGQVALGNAIGSNIFNTLAILGIAALVGGLTVHRRLVRVDVPLLVGVTLLVWWLAADGSIGVGEGTALLAGIVVYTAVAYVLGRRGERSAATPAPATPAPATSAPATSARATPAPAAPPTAARGVLLVGIGLLALVGGAQLLVHGATSLATALGVSDLVIGLTVVAAGTSLPELATSVVATRRGERDIAVGNIVGSNLFNLLGVLGAAAIAGGGLDVASSTIATDLPVLLLATLLAVPMLVIGRSVARWEGLVLLLGYGAYVTVLALDGVGGRWSAAAPSARLGLLVALAGGALTVLVINLVARRRLSSSRLTDESRAP